ncbi:APH(3') family aminoglycoside O-phosphotransferase [Kitasatospora sp. cg17-2]
MDRTLRHRYSTYEWTPVTDGDSGALVHLLVGPRSNLYAKIAPAAPDGNPALDLAAEADRLAWLADQGIPVPRIVDRGADADAVWLVTEAVPGVGAAEEWPAHRRPAVAAAIAGIARALHELPVDKCPFDRSLATAVPLAEQAVAYGLVDLENLEDEREGWSGERLLAELRRTRPADEDLVVCHGDLCPNNVLIDPDTLTVTGLIDVGRLGRADRHSDLAIALRELRHVEDPWFGPDCVESFLERYGATELRSDRIAFYQLLDEFF